MTTQLRDGKVGAVQWLRVKPRSAHSDAEAWRLSTFLSPMPAQELSAYLDIKAWQSAWVTHLRIRADGGDARARIILPAGGRLSDEVKGLLRLHVASALGAVYPEVAHWGVQLVDPEDPALLERAIHHATSHMPAAAPLLRAAHIGWVDGAVEVVVHDQAALGMLKKGRIEQTLAGFWHRLTGFVVPVALRLEELPAEALRQEEEARLLRLVGAAEAAISDGVAGDEGSGGGGRRLVAARADAPTSPEPGTLLLGRPVRGEPVRMADLQPGPDWVVVEGKVTHVEVREVGRRSLWLVDLTDLSDSVTVKFFANKGEEQALQVVEVGTWLRAQGRFEFDRFAGEAQLSARDLMTAAERLRLDTSAEKRVELHCHTKMSAMDAVSDVEELIRRAALWGHPALAITDHGVLQAFPEAHAAARRHHVKVIYGIEAYLQVEEEDLTKPYNHAIILARNQQGLRTLYMLVTKSQLETFYRVPRIPKSLLASERENLLVGTACERGELMRALLAGRDEAAVAEIAAWYDYLEIQPIANDAFMVAKGLLPDLDAIRALNRRIVELGERLGKPVCATSDSHFIDPEDEAFRGVLHAGQGYQDGESPAPLFFHTTAEMMEEFAYLGAERCQRVVIEGPQQIASLCDDGILPVPEGLHSPELPGAAEELEQTSNRRARELYGEPLPEPVRERLDYEIHAIIDHGFSSLYMIAERLVKKSLADGYLVGSRGSVGSSLVATMLGITEVNPLPPHYRCPSCRHTEFPGHEPISSATAVHSGFDLPARDCPACGTTMVKDGHDIPFAVFMGFHGDKVPDIDLNFSGEYQPRIHQYTEELLGHGHVFRAGTISTVAERTAIAFVKKWAEQNHRTLRQAEQRRLVAGCTGVRRTTGQHPGGLMVVPQGEDVFRFTPLQHPADDRSSGTITTHFDYHSISERLVKLDLLGHDDPTVLRLLGDLTGVDVRAIPFDDPATLALFSGTESLGLAPAEIDSEVGSLGLPEFGTRFVRGMLQETRPRTFAELVRISGLSHGTDVWNNNAQELVHSGVASLQEVISTRDDIMLSLISWGVERSHAFAIMERVRKGKGLREVDVQMMRAAGVPSWFIDSCRKISYLFPKAHAIAYVMMALRIAWFKVHQPLAFYAAYFTVRADDFDATWAGEPVRGLRERLHAIEQKGFDASVKEKSQQVILQVAVEMLARGRRFFPIDSERSQAALFQPEGDGLRVPFATIEGLGTKAAATIVARREERPFSSREDLRQRAHLSRNVLELLAACGALQQLPENDQIVLF